MRQCVQGRSDAHLTGVSHNHNVNGTGGWMASRSRAEAYDIRTAQHTTYTCACKQAQVRLQDPNPNMLCDVTGGL